MKKIVLLLLGLVLISGCKGSGVRSFVRGSSEYPPDWIDISQEDDDYVYFSGVASQTANLQDGKAVAFSEAAYDLISYVGIRVDVELYQEKKFTEADEVTEYIEDLYSYVGASGSANVEIFKQEVYWEEYSDGSYDVYMLIRTPMDSVEAARDEITRLAAEQRENAVAKLDEATVAYGSGDVSTALVDAYTAMWTAEKAAENIDVFDEAKALFYKILSSLSISMISEPAYAYSEGGSDLIMVEVNSSLSDDPVKGVRLGAFETDERCSFNSSTGYVSDEDGRVHFEVLELLDDSDDSLQVGVSFSMEGWLEVDRLNYEFLAQLEDLQDSGAVYCTLDIGSLEFVVPTTVVVVQGEPSGTSLTGLAFNEDLQAAITGVLSDGGFIINSVTIPNSTLVGRSADNLRQSIIQYIQSNNPTVRRMWYGLQEVNDLGPMPARPTWRSVQVDLTLSLIDMESGEVQDTLSYSKSSYGLNMEQAADNAVTVIQEQMTAELAEKLE